MNLFSQAADSRSCRSICLRLGVSSGSPSGEQLSVSSVASSCSTALTSLRNCQTSMNPFVSVWGVGRNVSVISSRDQEQFAKRNAIANIVNTRGWVILMRFADIGDFPHYTLRGAFQRRRFAKSIRTCIGRASAGLYKEKNTLTQNIRLIGFLKLAVGALIFAGVAHYFMRHGLRAGLNPFLIIIPAMPGCFALLGLVELVTGVPSSKVASAWDALAGWQRGILGILVVALAFILMMVGVVLFA
jgi:hypothetical protein